MANELNDIIDIKRDNNKYFISLVQKQNQSGMFYNQRLFFLHSTNCIGYISSTNTPLDSINFNNPKTTILISKIKSIKCSGQVLTIGFFLLDGDEKSKKTWILKFKYEQVAKKWHNKLQNQTQNLLIKQEKQQINSTQLKIPSEQKIQDNYRLSFTNVKMQKQHKHLQLCRTLEYAINNHVVSPSSSSPAKKQKINAQQQLRKIINHRDANQKDAPILSKSQLYSTQPIAKSKERPSGQTNIELKSKQNLSNHGSPQLNKNLHHDQTHVVNTPISALKLYQDNRPQFPQAITINKRVMDYKERENEQGRRYEKRTYLNKLQKLIKEAQTQMLVNPKQKDVEQMQQYGNQIGQEQTIKNINSVSNISYNKQPTNGSPYIPWTFRYVKYREKIIHQFQKYTQQLFAELINNVYQLKQPKRYKPKLIKNNIHYYDINDIEVKLSFIELQSIPNHHNETLCLKQADQLLENQYKNYQILHHYLDGQSKLKIPLMSLCLHQGFKALFKVRSNFKKKYLKYSDLRNELKGLQEKSSLVRKWNENIHEIIIELDQKYYQQFKTPNDRHLNFHLYFIQEISDFNDEASQSKSQIQYNSNIESYSLTSLDSFRKQLIQNYGNDVGSSSTLIFSKEIQSSVRDNYHFNSYDDQKSNLLKYLTANLSNVIVEMDSLNAWFMNSSQFSSYVHQRGINIRFIGYIYDHLKNSFQKKFIMTEIASRCVKLLYRKTVQMLAKKEGKLTFMELKDSVCSFLNCILGNSYETVEVWRVLSLHAKHYYGLSLNLTEIDKKILIIALISNCKLKVNYNLIQTQKIFESNTIFNAQNLLSMQTTNKSIVLLPQLHLKLTTLLQTYSHQNFETLLYEYKKHKQEIKLHLFSVEEEIKLYLAYYISPLQTDSQYLELQIYSKRFRPSRIYFEIMIIQLKWLFKLDAKEQCNLVYQIFVEQAFLFYGQAHPVYFQFYDLLATYYFSQANYDKAILYAKNSLLNSLKICGTYHPKTSDYYYYIANCYIKLNNIHQAIQNILISKNILQNNRESHDIPYATLCMKLGLLYLNSDHIQQCKQQINDALAILESKFVDKPNEFQDQYTECLQLLSRCYEIKQSAQQLKDLSLQCCLKFKHTHNPANLQKLIKIYMNSLFRQLSQQNASNYLDLISLLTTDVTQQTYLLAFECLSQRIQQDTFTDNSALYMTKITQIQTHVRSLHILEGWVNFSSIYQRQTIKDFINLTIQLLTFLGQGFITGCLRQCL